MTKVDLRDEFSKFTGKPFNIEFVVYNDYVEWLEHRILENETLHSVEGAFNENVKTNK